MNPGNIFLYFAFFSGLLSFVLLFRKPSITIINLVRPYRLYAVFVSAVSLTMAVVILLYYFLTSDFSIHYVYSYSSQDLGPIYKLSAIWTGEAGSMLFLTWIMLLVAVYFYKKYPGMYESSIILGISLLLLLLTISLAPFTSTLEIHPEMTAAPEDGLGLNPLLVNIWMVFHPPGIFIGYALMSAVFACGVIRSKGWESRCRVFARWAWLILGAGIISGCIWSYEVWESYWIWDPAFTSSLMVWLIFTAYLHTAIRFRKRGDFSLLSPAVGIFSFILALYSTHIIRSGTIQSVHSFGEGGRNLMLLYLVVALSVFSIAVIARHAVKRDTAAGSTKNSHILSDENLYLLTTLLFILLSAVLFTGLSYTLILDMLGEGMAVSIALFNDWSYPLTVLLVVVMGVCMFEPEYRRIALVLAAVSVILSSGLNITGDRYGDISAAVIVFAGTAGLYRIGRSVLSNTSLRGRLRLLGPHLIHLGVALMLIGVLMSTYTTSETVYFRSFNEKKAVGGFEIQLVDLAFPVTHDHMSATLTKIGTYNIYKKDGPLIGKGEASFMEKEGEFITEHFIYSGLFSDVRITYQGIGTTSPVFISFANINIVPGMTVIWLGCLLIMLGIIPAIFLRKS